MNRRAFSAAPLVIASCGSSDAPSASTASAASLPCEVEEVLLRDCRRCHSSPPAIDAPMPLIDAADVREPARSDPGMSIVTRIGERIQDPVAPMPRGGRLSASDLATLDAWLGGGAPSREAGATCRDAGGIATIGAGPASCRAHPMNVRCSSRTAPPPRPTRPTRSSQTREIPPCASRGRHRRRRRKRRRLPR